jgi:hypothetical protein
MLIDIIIVANVFIPSWIVSTSHMSIFFQIRDAPIFISHMYIWN